MVHERADLFERLDQMAPLTVVQGPKGLGKTVLVASWLALKDSLYQQRWIDGSSLLDAEEVIDAVENIWLNLEKTKVTEHNKTETFIVIDDLKMVINDDLLHKLEKFLLCFPQVQIIICSPWCNPKSVWAVSRKIEINVIGPNGLLVNEAELYAILKKMGFKTIPTEVADLHSTFGGWIAPIRYALNYSDGHEIDIAAAHWQAWQYVLPKMAPPHLISAAELLSLSNLLTVELVETLKRNLPAEERELFDLPAEELISQLELHGLIEADYSQGSKQAWVICEPVASTLRSRARKRPDAQDLDRAFIKMWLSAPEGEQPLGTVLIHARQCRSWKTLSDLWDSYGLTLFDHYSELAMKAFAGLPDEIHRQYGKLWAVGRIVDAAVGAGSGLRPGNPVPVDTLNIVTSQRTGLVELVIASERIAELVADGKPTQAMQYAKQRSHDLSGISTDKIRQKYGALAWFQLRWGLAANAAGKRRESLKIFTSCLKNARLSKIDFIISVVSARLAMHNMILGYRRDALRLSELLEESTKRQPELLASSIIDLSLVHATLALDRGDREAAAMHLEKINNVDQFAEQWPIILLVQTYYALHFGDPEVFLDTVHRRWMTHGAEILPGTRNSNVMLRCEADLLMAIGGLNAANEVLNTRGKNEPNLLVPRTRLLLIAGEYEECSRVAISGLWSEKPVVRSRMELLLLLAASAWFQGKFSEASETFLQSVHLAKEIGTISYYGTIPTVALEGLMECTGLSYEDLDLGAVQGKIRQTYPETGRLINLSEREKTVLQAMGRLETLPQVAEELGVSLNTVKKQSAAIYHKLGVHNRVDALETAHRLHLLV